MDLYFKPIVLVTGFGPFENHPVNASWEGVKELPKEKIEEKHNIELVCLEIPVTYGNVDEFIPALWETHTPKLVIHVGVSSVAHCLTIETVAHRKNYTRMDYFGNLPANGDNCCTREGPVKIKCGLDVKKIVKGINKQNEDIKAVTSEAAGRYLCEYTYYTSLSIDCDKSLFVHVPDLQVYDSKKTARGLEQIIDMALEQLDECENKKECL